MKDLKEHLFIMTDTQSANFQGNPLCQVTYTCPDTQAPAHVSIPTMQSLIYTA